MITTQHVTTMAAYNRWQNTSLFEAAESLSEADRRRDQGAFFRSIEETLNHLLWADRIWMHRLADFPAPAAPDISASVRETASWEELRHAREEMDRRIIDWALGLADADLEGDLTWRSLSADKQFAQPRWLLVTHLFNHQTHHRGQVHAMLTAQGARPQATDLPFMPKDT